SAADENGPNAEEAALPAQRVRTGTDGSIVINVDLPSGYHLNPAAPQRYRISIEQGEKQIGLVSPSVTGVIGRDREVHNATRELKLPLRIPFRAFEAGKAELCVQLTLFYCRTDNTGTCHIKTLVWRAPVEVINNAGAQTEVRIDGRVG